MDFIIAGKDRIEKSFLSGFERLDVDVGKENDFELQIPRSVSKKLAIEPGGFLFCPDTEYGGLITRVVAETSGDTTQWSGITWRGLLELDIITPPSGQDYRKASGEANAILRTVLYENDAVGSLFTVPDTDSSIVFNNYQFGRYTDKLRGFSKMLLGENYRLQIRARQGGPNEVFSVSCEAVPVVDWSSEYEYSDDYQVSISVSQDDGGINHLICLGKGELAARQRVDLYMQADGTVGASKYYSGFDERVAVFECSSGEGVAELAESGKERLLELANSKSLALSVCDIDVDVGDIVGGRDREFGIELAKPVISKIVRIGNNQEEIELNVEGKQSDEDDDKEM